ncbi:MAG: aryldialkylphosphatase [Chloroflexi bacterium]|nr:aryldialkylphosphatase [Chloroflexota bacterium]
MTVGRVRTVLGDVDPATLGRTMTHEHLLIGFGRWRREAGILAGSAPPALPELAGPLTWENSGLARRRGHPDNSALDDVDLAVSEALRFMRAGGGAIVDATNPDLTRNPHALRAIAERTGLHVVMGCGHYVHGHHPLDMDARTVDALVAEIVEDVTRGADGTEIRAGVIGEIGSEYPMVPNEVRALGAAARASRITGAALLIHPGRDPRAPLETVRVVVEAGGATERTIVGHLDRTLFDPADMLALARTGCYLEWDLFGDESSYYALAPIDMPNDATRIDHLRRLIAEGFGERLLVAQDICRKTSLCRYGGLGYAHILENVVPIMRRKGMSEDEIEAILVRNPARVLALAAPAPDPAAR